ncbi:uncharacterized protein LOC110242666 [Exaiptasia diaphana]|uniref:Uncharacterized protein n=1 Tax=Exaiptasia diaphana TaxID=2652724 RepID=A0A913XH99_EXADI|nr:uncharacterized protein LOC110242666 [Exaiptasia diaphana]
MCFVERMGWQWPRDAVRFLSVSVLDVQDYRDWLQSEYSAKTVNRRLSSLSSWFKYLSASAAELRLPINIPNPAHAQFIPRGQAEPEKPAQALGLGTVRKLLTLPEGDDPVSLRDKAVLALFFYSGARIGAIARLEVEDLYIDDDNGAELMLEEKGGKTRKIGLHTVAASAVAGYVEQCGLESGPLFRRASSSRSRELGDEGLSTRSLRSLLRRYYQQLPDGDRFSPHSARATVATELLEAGVDLAKVQELLGHRSITTTMEYDKRRRSTKQSASHDLPY